MPQNSSLTPDQMDQMLEHAQQALQSSIQKNSGRYGDPEEGFIDFKNLGRDALVRLDPDKTWQLGDEVAAKAAVIQKFGVDMPLEKLAEQQNELKAAQKKLEALEKLGKSDVLATPDAVSKNERDIAAQKKLIEELNTSIEDTQMQVNEGRAMMNASLEDNPMNKKDIVAAANADLAADDGKKEAQGEALDGEKKSVRFAVQAQVSKDAKRSGFQMGSQREGKDESVRNSQAWLAAQPDTAQKPSGPKLR